jgi:hypothetical protein
MSTDTGGPAESDFEALCQSVLLPARVLRGEKKPESELREMVKERDRTRVCFEPTEELMTRTEIEATSEPLKS